MLQSQDCIAAALACSRILKELSKEEDDTDSTEEMLTLAEEYEHRAIGESGPGLFGFRCGPNRNSGFLLLYSHLPDCFAPLSLSVLH